MPQKQIFMVVLPVPPAGLGPNARLHYQQRARLRRTYQAAVAAAVWEAYPRHASPRRTWPQLGLAAGEVTFTYPDRRRRDIDNLFAALKSAIDVLVRLGVIDDDGPQAIARWQLRYRVDPGSPAGVLVVLRSLPALTEGTEEVTG